MSSSLFRPGDMGRGHLSGPRRRTNQKLYKLTKPLNSVSMSVAVVGASGLGKTRTLVEIFTMKRESYLLVRNLEDLKEYDHQQHIIFDDCDFQFKSPEFVIGLTDSEYPTTVRILRQAITIQPDTTRWFLSNTEKCLTPIRATQEQLRTITRRYQLLKPVSRLDLQTQLLIQFAMVLSNRHKQQPFSWLVPMEEVLQSHLIPSVQH